MGELADDQSQRSRAKSIRILIVDDEPDTLYGLDRHVTDQLDTVEVVLATDPRLALEEVKNGVHVLISDQRMPGMTGLELIHRAREIIPGLPAILTTAYPDLELAMRAVNEEHVSSFIVKPFILEDVVSKIEDVLEGRR